MYAICEKGKSPTRFASPIKHTSPVKIIKAKSPAKAKQRKSLKKVQRGQGTRIKSAVRQARQISAYRHYTPSTQKLFQELRNLQAQPGQRGFSTPQLMYRQLVADLRPQGYSMKEIAAQWQRMKGGHRQPSLRGYYKAHADDFI